MTRAMTPTFWSEIAHATKEEHLLLFIRLDHRDLAEPILIVNDTVDYVRNDQVYYGWPINFKMPNNSEGPARGSIIFENIDQRISQTIKVLKGKVSLSFFLVYKSAPAEIITSYQGLFLINVEAKTTYVQAEIVSHGHTATGWPSGRATPARTPGLHV
jgi:hypothetical protein